MNTGQANDEQVIEKLRGAATGGPPATEATVAAVVAGGRRIRRRRHALLAGTAALAVMCAGVLALNLPGGAGQSVIQDAAPADGAPDAAPAAGDTPAERRERNLERLRTALGADSWAFDYGSKDGRQIAAALHPVFSSPGIEGLPSGVQVTADISVQPTWETAAACDPTDDAWTCTVRHAPDGSPVRLAHRGDEQFFTATHVTYIRPDGNVAWVDLAVTGDFLIDDPARNARTAAWLAGFDDALVAVATDPAVEAEHPEGLAGVTVQPTPAEAAVVELPNVVGVALDEARRLLAAAGFAEPEVTVQISDRTAGSVLRQVPAAGLNVGAGTRVSLVVAQAPAAEASAAEASAED